MRIVPGLPHTSGEPMLLKKRRYVMSCHKHKDARQQLLSATKNGPAYTTNPIWQLTSSLVAPKASRTALQSPLNAKYQGPTRSRLLRHCRCRYFRYLQVHIVPAVALVQSNGYVAPDNNQ
jgi:hypothetical protein